MTTKTEGGGAASTWQSDDDGGRPFTKDVQFDGWIEVQSRDFVNSAVAAEQRPPGLSESAAEPSLVTQEILYYAQGAGEVWLIWGLDQWKTVPLSARPSETVVKNGLMHTPMARRGDTFSAKVRIPPKTRMNYKFLITKTDTGTHVEVTEEAGGKSFQTAGTDSLFEVQTRAHTATPEQRGAWLAGKVSDLTLVSRDLSYRSMSAGDVWLFWGIDGWQAIPEAARPPGTVIRDGVMTTPMTRKGNLLATTIRVPPGAVIDCELVIDRPNTPRPAKQNGTSSGGTLLAEQNSLVIVKSALTKFNMERRKAWPSGRVSDLSLVTQEIRYRIAGAEDVWFVWGINGWQAIPEEARPPGTLLRDDTIMHTPMTRHGDTFTASVRVPPGTVVDFKFLITKTNLGTPVSIWQDSNGRDFWKSVQQDGRVEEKATVSVVTAEERKAWLAGKAADLPLVTQEIRYHAPDATETWLRWGLDGWQSIPEGTRPPDTVLAADGTLRTRMVQKGDTFVASVRLPPGSMLDFGFLIARTKEGKSVDIWQDRGKEGDVLSRVAMFDGSVEIESTAWLLARTSSPSSLATQQFRYRIAGAEKVWLVWGVNGWQPIPEEVRPKGTVLHDRVMRTPMVAIGDLYVATVQVLPGATVDYKFLITKTSRGAPVAIWQDAGGKAFQLRVRISGARQEEATVSVVTQEQRRAWLSGQATDLPLVRQEIRYRDPEATEAWLIWGLDGWQASPEAARPPGTILKDKQMRSRMVRRDNGFVTVVHLPPGTELNGWILVNKDSEGKIVEFRQTQDSEGRTLSRIVSFDGGIDVRPIK